MTSHAVSHQKAKCLSFRVRVPFVEVMTPIPNNLSHQFTGTFVILKCVWKSKQAKGICSQEYRVFTPKDAILISSNVKQCTEQHKIKGLVRGSLCESLKKFVLKFSYLLTPPSLPLVN